LLKDVKKILTKTLKPNLVLLTDSYTTILGIKFLTTLILMLSTFQILAQRLNGVVTDKSTNLPISSASLSCFDILLTG
jgi:hypothetical protein